jgi:hypothetical protein
MLPLKAEATIVTDVARVEPMAGGCARTGERVVLDARRWAVGKEVKEVACILKRV